MFVQKYFRSLAWHLNKINDNYVILRVYTYSLSRVLTEWILTIFIPQYWNIIFEKDIPPVHRVIHLLWFLYMYVF